MLNTEVLKNFSLMAAILLVVYLLLSPVVAMPIYKTMLFFPVKYPSGAYEVPAVDNFKKEDLTYPSGDGVKLHAWFFRNPESDKVVLVSHGNGGNLTYRLYVARALLQSGASVFLYDYRGYGKSEGSPSLSGICADARASYDYLRDKLGYEPNHIILYGESLGSGVTCWLSQRVPSEGIILASGFSSLLATARSRMNFLYLFPNWLCPPDFDNLTVLKQDHPPLLLVHGVEDTILPVSNSDEIFRLAKDPKYFTRIPGKGHNDLPESPMYAAALSRFIPELSKPSLGAN